MGRGRGVAMEGRTRSLTPGPARQTHRGPGPARPGPAGAEEEPRGGESDEGVRGWRQGAPARRGALPRGGGGREQARARAGARPAGGWAGLSTAVSGSCRGQL